MRLQIKLHDSVSDTGFHAFRFNETVKVEKGHYGQFLCWVGAFCLYEWLILSVRMLLFVYVMSLACTYICISFMEVSVVYWLSL